MAIRSPPRASRPNAESQRPAPLRLHIVSLLAAPLGNCSPKTMSRNAIFGDDCSETDRPGAAYLRRDHRAQGMPQGMPLSRIDMWMLCRRKGAKATPPSAPTDRLCETVRLMGERFAATGTPVSSSRSLGCYTRSPPRVTRGPACGIVAFLRPASTVQDSGGRGGGLVVCRPQRSLAALLGTAALERAEDLLQNVAISAVDRTHEGKRRRKAEVKGCVG